MVVNDTMYVAYNGGVAEMDLATGTPLPHYRSPSSIVVVDVVVVDVVVVVVVVDFVVVVVVVVGVVVIE